MNNPNYLTVKTIINDIEEKWDKNSNRYYRVSVKWTEQSRIFYAFATDYRLNLTTLQLLQVTPHRLINQQVLIIYEELTNKQAPNWTFARIKEIQLT